jgi:hypothetical protein
MLRSKIQFQPMRIIHSIADAQEQSPPPEADRAHLDPPATRLICLELRTGMATANVALPIHYDWRDTG